MKRFVLLVMTLVAVTTTSVTAAQLPIAATAPAIRAASFGEPAVAPIGDPWVDMDYGSFLTASLQVEKGNIAQKGIAIRVDPGGGGVSAGRDFLLFDTDLLRYAAGWQGEGFIDWRNIAFDGGHGTHASIVGSRVFVNPLAPGWAGPDGGFEASRVVGLDDREYGPLPREWAHWKGLYRHGDQVVLHYTVGGTEVHEVPGLEVDGPLRVLTRTVELGARASDLVMQVAHDSAVSLVLRDVPVADGVHGKVAAFLPMESGIVSRRFEGNTRYVVQNPDAIDMTSSDFTIRARIRTEKGGVIFSKTRLDHSWVPDGKALFVRGGRLCYDIGWVGVVTSRRSIDDGEWHDVAMTWSADRGRIQMFIDGDLDGGGELAPNDAVEDHGVQLGFAAGDFPNPSPFEGDIESVEFHAACLTADQLGQRNRDHLRAEWKLADLPESLRDHTGNGHDARRVGAAGSTQQPRTTMFAVRGDVEGLEWVMAEGSLRLRIPEGDDPRRLEIHHAPIADPAAIDRFEGRLMKPGRLLDVAALRGGGPTQWSESLPGRSAPMGPTGGAYEVDELSPPSDNPWRSWMRIGGFDFLPDGDRIAVCTWMGDVWIGTGLNQSGALQWRRVAAGLFQPLGLKVRGGEIFVLGRDQITRLADRNGDGEFDHYVNFNNDAQVTEHFHEFAMDLQADDDGNFYYMKGGRHAKDAVVPQHGTLLKVSADGDTTTRVAYGFRAPNGLCLNGDGSFLTSDQEGHWIPANRINWVRPGDFHGYQWSYHEGERPTTYTPPLCWVDHDFDISPAAQLWVDSQSFGPIAGAMLSFSYGTGHCNLVLHEEVNGVYQGGVTRLPIALFPTGIMRGRFRAEDGHLYLAGLFGWSSRRTAPGGLFRVRYTGAAVDVPIALHAVEDGVILRFSAPLDVERAGRTGAWQVQRWNYKWAQRYGSDDFRVSDGEPGREAVTVTAVEVSPDGTAIRLHIDDMRPCMQMNVKYRLRSAAGARVGGDVFHTVHSLGSAERFAEWFPR